MDAQENRPTFRRRILNNLGQIMTRIRQLSCCKSDDVVTENEQPVGSRKVPRSKTSLSVAKNVNGTGGNAHLKSKRQRDRPLKWFSTNRDRRTRGNQSWAERSANANMSRQLDEMAVEELDTAEGHVSTAARSSSTTLSHTLLTPSSTNPQSSGPDDWLHSPTFSPSEPVSGPSHVSGRGVSSSNQPPREGSEVFESPTGSEGSLDSRRIDSILDQLLEETTPAAFVYSDHDVVAHERVGDQ